MTNGDRSSIVSTTSPKPEGDMSSNIVSAEPKPTSTSVEGEPIFSGGYVVVQRGQAYVSESLKDQMRKERNERLSSILEKYN